MIKIILANIRGRLFACAVLAAVLTASLFLAVPPLHNVLEMLADEWFYRRTGLENLYYFDAGGRDVGELSKSLEGKISLIGAGYNAMRAKDGFADFTPVDEGFFEQLDFGFRKKLKNTDGVTGCPAVVSKTMGSYYNLGETYTEAVTGPGFVEFNLTFTVVGVLSGDRGYFYSWQGIRHTDNFIYFLPDDETPGLFPDGNIYFTADSLESAKAAVAAAGEQFDVISFAESNAVVRGASLKKLSVPIILTLASFLLSLCMTLSHSILTAAAYKKRYAVLFACGCTREKLLLIHILSDLAPVLLAVFAAALMTVLNILKGPQVSILRQYTPEGLLAAVLEAAAIFAAAEAAAAGTVLGARDVGLADER